jgi:hypothetical protein
MALPIGFGHISQFKKLSAETTKFKNFCGSILHRHI